MLSGQHHTAETAARSILEREPLAGAPRLILGEVLRTAGDTAGAIREERRVLEQAPFNIAAVYYLVLAYMDEGDLKQARALLDDKRPMFDTNYLWRLAHALLLALENQPEQALVALDAETLKFASAIYLVTLQLAECYAVLGDAPRALAALDQAVRNGDERVDWFLQNPRLAAIRQEPRFEQIVAAIRSRRAQPR